MANRNEAVATDTPLTVRSVAPIASYVALLLITYGYEIFSFNLTVDEPVVVTAGNKGWSLILLGQGRWGLSIVDLLQPTPAVPVVGTALSVGLTATALWLFARKLMGMMPWPSVMTAGIAVTLPSLAMSFSWLSPAWGIGSVCVLIFGWAVWVGGRWLLVAAVMAGAFAVGIYESFAIALVAVAIAHALKTGLVRRATLGIAMAVVAALLSRGIGLVLQYLADRGSSAYVAKYVGGGLIDNPMEKLTSAFKSLASAVALSDGSMGIQWPWLGLLLVITCAGSLAVTVRLSSGRKDALIRGLALLALLAIPIMTELAAVTVPLRSMLYLPFIVVAISQPLAQGIAGLQSKTRAVAQVAFTTLVLLALLQNATLANRLYSTADYTLAHDRFLAFQIDYEVAQMAATQGLTPPLPLMIVGSHAWTANPATPIVENLGVSLFQGEFWRGEAFLRGQGVPVIPATPQQRADLTDYATQAPAYPTPGWISIHDGVVVVKFGPAQ